MKTVVYSLLAVVLSALSASAAVVVVNVAGTGYFSVANGQLQPPELGNGHFVATFSYEDSTVGSSDTYAGALLSFSMTFSGGATFSATGGDIVSRNGDFHIQSVTGADFPTLAGKDFNGMVFKLFSSNGGVPLGQLPTAAELNELYSPFFSWVIYGNNVNGFILTQSSFTAVPEPSCMLIAAGGLLGFVIRRRR
ncbi:MAG: PEP-CTERM sorting domain-containing protein [Luteolibacter sp.]